MDIATWLRKQGLERYEQAFRDNDIDVGLLPDLTEADLEKIGVTSLGHRKMLLRAVGGLQPSGAEPATNTTASAEETSLARLTPVARSEAERRQLTVMFVDLVGSTALAARLDPEDMGRVIRAYQECCAEVIKGWDGHVAKYMGDGVLAYFGWPRAHEDEAERAARAGLDITDAVGQLTGGDGAPLSARIGIATGMVMVGDLIGEGAAQEESVVGETPNRAARLQAMAEPGSVIIDPRCRQLIGGLFEYTDLGERDLKGFTEPIHVWRVLGESRAESRFEALHSEHLTVLVGREHEIGLLVDRWERAKEGEGQVVLLSGEPGIGKSRIVQALRERLADQLHTPLSHYCSPYHTNSAFYPVIGLLERAAGFARDDGPESRLDKLEALLARGTEALGEAVSLVAALLEIETGERYAAPALSPQRQKQRTLEVLVDQVEGLAAEQPVLAVYEDVHWVDPTTLEVLELLIERVQRLPVLVLITFRPEFDPPWTGHAHVMQLSLSRLTRRHGRALVAEVTGGKPLPADVFEQLLAKTDGVPLFVEELTKTVLESGLLTDAGDHYDLAGPLTSLAIPATLHDSLMARLDRLAPVKEIAQIGAVIGREFSHELIAAVSTLSESDLNFALDQLVTSELIFRRGTPPAATYSFKHALVQEAAYQSLLISKRRQLHASIAQRLEDGDLGVSPEILALHFHEGGDLRRAARYWGQAGDGALARSAQTEAAAHYGKALEALSLTPDKEDEEETELSLLLRLGQAQFGSLGGAAKETIATYQRASDLARTCNALTEQWIAQYGLWVGRIISGQRANGLATAEDLANLAEEHDQAWMKAVARRLLATPKYLMGKLVEAQADLEDVLASEIDLQNAPTRFGHDPLFTTPSTLAHVEWSLGQPDSALNRSEAILGRASEMSQNPNTLSYVLVWDLILALLCRDAQRARRTADWLGKHTELSGAKFWGHMCTWGTGSIEVLEGDPRHGLTILKEGIRGYMATGALQYVPLVKAFEVEGQFQLGNCGESLSVLEQTQEIVNTTNQFFFLPEIHRLRGIITDAMGRREEAEKYLRQAVLVARQQGNRSWELRSLTSLARLLRDDNRFIDAQSELSAVYRSFNEGHDLADLTAAAALLA